MNHGFLGKLIGTAPIALVIQGHFLRLFNTLHTISESVIFHSCCQDFTMLAEKILFLMKKFFEWKHESHKLFTTHYSFYEMLTLMLTF